MGPILVGVEGLTADQFAWTILNSSSAPILVDSWSTLAVALGISPIKREELRKDYDSRRLTLLELISQIIRNWILIKGEKATFNELLSVILEKCKWADIGDQIWEKHHAVVPDGTTWSDLHERSQTKLLDAPVKFLEQETTIRNLLSYLSHEEHDRFVGNLSAHIIRDFFVTPPPLKLTSVSGFKTPEYYIPRVISLGNQLNQAVFKSSTNDKFVIEGLSLSELSQLAGKEFVDKSWPHKQQYTSRFIQLLRKDDFDHIIRVEQSVPCHLITYNNKKYFWTRSNGITSTIRENLNGKTVKLSEESFLKTIDASGKIVVVADCPGMGKSVLLANIFNAVCKVYPSHLNLLINSSDLAENITDGLQVTHETLVECIVSTLAKCKLGTDILRVILSSKKLHKNLFMDAFDEVPQDKQAWLAALLQKVNSIPLVNLYVTTRLHKCQQLESVLNTISYKILPLSTNEQRDLLVNYWHHVGKLDISEHIKEFANKIVRIGLKNVDPREMEFAGIPLQCRMLAEIYLDEAKNYVNTDATVILDDVSVHTYSIYNLFTKLVDDKIRRLENEGMKTNLFEYHTKFALQTLFRNLHGEIDSAIKVSNYENLDNILDTIGIIVRDKNLKASQFLHRSYAEYFVARWLLDAKSIQSSVKHTDLWLRILFEHVLNPTSTWGDTEVLLERDINAEEFYDYMVTLPGIEDFRKNWKSVMSSLGLEELIDPTDSECILQNQLGNGVSTKRHHDILYCMLHKWTESWKTPRPISLLINALSVCNLKDISEGIARKYYKKDFASGVVAFLINSGYMDHNNSLDYTLIPDDMMPRTMPSGISTIIQPILDSCMRHDYIKLFTFIMNVISESSLPPGYITHYVNWFNVLEVACLFSTVELVVLVCEYMKNSLYLDSKKLYLCPGKRYIG